MKKLVFILFAFAVQINLFSQEYFPEGTKWTEIRLDTLKYDSWYSKVGDEWMPNFETIEYRVEGEYTDPINGVYNCVYTNGPEWTDSLALLIHEGLYSNSSVEVSVPYYYSDGCIMWPGEVYQFDWSIGKGLYYRDIQEANSTGAFPIMYFYGIIDEIKEGYFGGVRPLKYADLDGKAPDKSSKDWDFGYTDTDGGRVIQGIGITEWNGGECLFGPAKPFDVMTWSNDNRHYRSMLVHFERDGEVLYDVWPEKETEEDPFQEYYPEGTKWTEIRLDTLKYDSWYSKVGDSLVPNFETIEYHVEGDYTEKWGDTYKCVFSNDPEWMGTPLLIKETSSDVSVSLIYDEESEGVMSPATAYQFDWSVGKGLYYQDIEESNSTGIVPYYFFYGVIDEIKEGYFGGVRPLKYVDLDGKAATLEFGYCIDTRGGRIIQGIGITEWNDGECLFGPPNPYFAMTGSYNDRHYRSMLVHFERDGEVLYDVWPEKPVAIEPVAFTEGQMATIVLPTEPDASKGKYYRLDRVEGNEIIFEQELQPRAHVPYIIVPSEDFCIEQSAMELDGLRSDTASVEGISFIGTFQKDEVESQEGFYIELIDTTPDCSLSGNKLTIGALRAYLLVRWDDPYNHGGTKVPAEKMQIVLRDDPNSIQMVNGKWLNGKCYDLSGKLVNRKSLNHKLPHGIYIKDGRKELK